MDAEQRQALWAEAMAIPDPGGLLLEGYYDALKAWASTHPEVDREFLQTVIQRQLWEHR